MNRIRRYWMWALPVLVGIAMGLSLTNPEFRPIVAVATTHVGPTRFTKYGMNTHNNPTFEGPSVATWSRHWTYNAGEPLQQASMANGVVYVSGDGGNLSSRTNDCIYALDAATGTLLWKTHLDNMSMTTPLVADGLVFVGTGTQGFSGSNLTAVNELNARHVIRGTGPSGIYALDASSGRVVWQYRTVGENMPTFVYHHGVLFVANGNGGVYAFNARTGVRQWALNMGSYVSMSSPTLAHGVLYVSGAHPYDLYAINVNTHRLLWASPIPHVFAGSDDSSLAYAHHLIYVMGTTGSWNQASSVVFAFNAQGQVVWQSRLGSGKLPTDIEVSAPVVVGTSLFVGSPITDQEYALNAISGKVLWTFRAAGPISESPAVAHQILYFGDGTGMFYALEATSGKELASRFLTGAFAADYPVVVGETIYQPDENGQMFAIPFSALTPEALHAAPNIPIPSGMLGVDIKKGEALFMGRSLSPTRISCDTCHLGGGTLSSFHDGIVIPSLLGAASGYPKMVNGKIDTLDGQINHCITGMGGKALSVNSRDLMELNLYLHWLSSGWADHLSRSRSSGSSSGGCK